MLKAVNSFLAEIQFNTTPASGATVNFQTSPVFSNTEMMQGIQIVGMETYSSQYLTFSETGRPIVTNNGISRILIGLREGSTDRVYMQPATSGQRAVNGGYILEYTGIRLNFSQCYLKITENAALDIVAGQSFCINFYYIQLGGIRGKK